MKKLSLCIVLLGILVFTVPSAMAVVLTFDDINSIPSYSTIPNGYGGLDWNNMGYMHSTNYATFSGYNNGIVSGEYVAFNLAGATAIVSNGVFDFNGAYFTAAWRDGLNIDVVGKLGGSTLYDQTITVNTSGPTSYDLNFLGIDELVFNSYGGVFNPIYTGIGGSGTQFAMDNFTFNAVPEPSTLLLFGTGLIGIGVFRRKFKG